METAEQMQALLHGPAMSPPPGAVPNVVNPDNKTQYFVLTVVLTVIAATLAFLMRIYTKACITRKLGWEDYTLALGYFMFIGYCVPTSLLIRDGGGVHQWNIRLKNLISILYYTNITSILYCFITFIIKLSILLQYLKIFTPVSKRNLMYWGTHLVIWLNFGFYVADIFAEIFLCNPREKYWDVLITTGHCYDVNAVNIASGAFNTFSDFLTLLLPQRVIWNLQMPLKRKLGVSAIFLTGLFVCVTSVLRLYYSVRLAQTGDVSYNLALMGFWTFAELSAGIVCACLPVLPKFFQTIGPKVTRMTGAGSSLGTIFGSSRGGRHSKKESWTSGESAEAGQKPHVKRLELRLDSAISDEWELKAKMGFQDQV